MSTHYSTIQPAHKTRISTAAAATVSGGPELSIVVPTFNERDNVERLVGLLRQTLHQVDWEVIFVDDDSPDRTAHVVRDLAIKDRRVRCLQRLGRRGLASACLEGVLSTSAPYVAVMDGDLQHDEQLLSQMLAELQSGDVDIVIGSRYTEGAGIGQWDRTRAMVSRIATRLSLSLIPRGVTDPMSGFFAMRRDVFEGIMRRTSGLGFKLLLDFFASAPRPLRFKEVALPVQDEAGWREQADSQVAWDYLMLLLDKHVGHLISVRVVAFSLVGGLGVLVHVAILFLCFRWLNLPFVVAQAGATLAAMTSNFALNNLITYHDRRLRGWQWVRGWMSFVLVCSIGAMANVGVAAYLFDNDYFWGLSALAGILVGTVWNYAVTSAYTWKAGH